MNEALAWQSVSQGEAYPRWQRSCMGKLESGEAVWAYRCQLDEKVEALFCTYGARLLSLKVPDRQGHVDEVTQTYPSLEAYLKEAPYHGAVCGPYANRLSHASFVLGGQTFHLEANEKGNCLHSASAGLHAQNWEAELCDGVLSFKIEHPDAWGGFPGNLQIAISYQFYRQQDEEGESFVLQLTYDYSCDRATPVSLTNHAYFTLGGTQYPGIHDQVLQLTSKLICELDEANLPTGVILPVEGTGFDFQNPTLLGERLQAAERYYPLTGGLDHNFILDKHERKESILAATLYDPRNGRVLRCETDMPGLQVYTVNEAPACYGPHSAICLETQYFPDAMRHVHFPSPVLEAGQKQRHCTRYLFSCRP